MTKMNNAALLLLVFAATHQIASAIRNVPVYRSRNLNLTTGDFDEGPRQGKWLPFYTVVRFKNGQCKGTNGSPGTCYLRSECKSKQGVAFGSCSRGLGVCCVVTRNCGGLPTSSNNTFFRNEGYPEPFGGGQPCTISIAKNRASVTHVRLTFTEFSLAQPVKETGVCTTDKLTFIGADSAPPTLCGENAGQHMYLKFLPDDSAMQIVITTDAANAFKRKWNILITQHEEKESPPPGCLMYYTEPAGQIKSFNYNSSATATEVRELANMNYAACIRTAASSCAIEWRKVDGEVFSLSGVVTPTLVWGDACVTDYVIIPNAASSTVSSDRYCGSEFPAFLRSSMKPFLLGVVTNGDAATDASNKGFNLQYSQIAC